MQCNAIAEEGKQLVTGLRQASCDSLKFEFSVLDWNYVACNGG